MEEKDRNCSGEGSVVKGSISNEEEYATNQFVHMGMKRVIKE